MFFYLGSAPIEENCVQVNPDENYISKMKNECNRYLSLLKKIRPIPEHLKNYVQYKIKEERHDFGIYYEVIILFDEENKEAQNFAFFVEDNIPLYWKEEIDSWGDCT